MSDRSRSLMALASGMRSWMTWAPADLSWEQTDVSTRGDPQKRSCCQDGHTDPWHPWVPSLTSQLLRSRCRSLTWLLYASPCSMALERSPEPPISMGNAGFAPRSPIPHPSKAPDSIHPKPTPLAGSHPHPTPDGIWRQLGTRHGDVPERTGLAEELLDVRRDGFHLPGRGGHKMASPHHPQPPACSPL